MDELISLIVAIGIIFSGIGKLIEKFSPDKADENKRTGRTGQNKIPGKNLSVDKDEPWVPVYQTNNLPIKDEQIIETANPSPEKIEKEIMKETVLRKKNTYKKREKLVHHRDNNRKKEKKKDIFQGELLEDDLIKGIIFKEILDTPRSRSPYKTVIKDRYQ